MELLLIGALMLVCPLVMGGVMYFMMRGMHARDRTRDREHDEAAE